MLSRVGAAGGAAFLGRRGRNASVGRRIKRCSLFDTVVTVVIVRHERGRRRQQAAEETNRDPSRLNECLDEVGWVVLTWAELAAFWRRSEAGLVSRVVLETALPT